MHAVEVILTEDPLDPEALRKSVEHVELGGVVVFCGEVRARTDDLVTTELEYVAYEQMAIHQMRQVASEASIRWDASVAVAHRLGTLVPGDIAVVTVAACAHRADAFEACKFLIDRIKDVVPIWKVEERPSGAIPPDPGAASE